jgi:hypothetical protein
VSLKDQPTLRHGVAAQVNSLPSASDFWQFPYAVMASSQINSGTDRHCTAHSPSGDDYAVWWDAQRRPIIGKWDATTRNWATFDLSTTPGNPLRSPAPDDGHNSLSIAVDGNGYIHVWGNQHDNVLRYTRSANANDITAWTMPGMTGSNENSVTYPEAIRLANGNLLMTYRNGQSGNGDQYLNLYTTSTATWTQVGQVFKGTAPVSPDESAYPAAIIQDSAGTLHWFYMWRQDDTLASSHDLSYIKSTDGGTTWQTAAGVVQTLPIQPSNTAPAIPGATGSITGLKGGPSVDANNVPHIQLWEGSSGAWNLHHFYYSAGAWHDDTVVANSTQGGTRPASWSTGTSTWAIYSKNNRATAVKVAPTIGSEVDLGQIPVAQWEGTTDTTYMAGYRTILAPSGTSLTAGAWGGVLTLTPAALDGADGEVKVKPTSVPQPSPAPQVGPVLVPGFYYTPPTGNRGNTTTQYTTAGQCSGSSFLPGSSAHLASLAARLVTAGSSDSTYRLLLIEVTSPTTGTIRAATAAANGATTGNIELSVENNAFASNVQAGKQYVLAVHYIGGTTGPFFTSIPGSAWNDPNIGQATLTGALIPNVNYAGYSVTAAGGGALSGTAAVGSTVSLSPTGTTPLVALKVTAAP